MPERDTPLDLSFEDPRTLLKRYGLRAKRGMSQNFLVSQAGVDAIVRAVGAAPGERVVELGAGLGTLTTALMRAGARVLAIERDLDMIRVLTAELGPHGLEIRRDDAACIDYAAIAMQQGSKVCVVGNLPYAITGAILRNLVESRASLSRAIVMVQREVRDRLVAEPGTADYGALTVFTSAAFEIDTVLRLPQGAFHPPPKVQSAVVRLVPRSTPLAEETDAFRAVVRGAFQSRRKTLRNALRACGIAQSDQALERAGIDPTRRGETLSVLEFDTLARIVALER
jgi:16S rRNA (adenine1518-N6/adenine1519-N6)-dimethyltransferase